jgi:hypothetical protein
VNRLRRSDCGSALPLALIIISVIAVGVAVLMSYSQVALKLTADVATVDTATAGVDGAADAAIKTVQPNTGQFVSPSCLTLAANQLGTAAQSDVTCVERTNSGAPVTTGLSGSQPVQAILATGSSNSAEGVQLPGTADVTVTGSVAAGPKLTEAAGGSLRVKGSISAASCSVAGTMTPTAACGASIAGDPGWTLPTTTYPTTATLPACAPYMSFTPGKYTSASSLNTLINGCSNSVIHFKPGVYYFEFADATPEWQIALQSTSTLIGGTPSGWTPGTTSAATIISTLTPKAASPSLSACQQAGNGVLFLFGGASRMNVTAGKVQLCGYATGGQIITIAGLPGSDVTVTSGTTTAPATTNSEITSAPTMPTGTSACRTSPPIGTWTNPSAAMTPDGTAASSTTGGATSACSDTLQLSGFGTVNSGSTNTNVTATITYSGTGSGQLWGRATFGNGSTATSPVAILNCDATTCTGTTKTVAVTFSNLTPAQANSLRVELWLYNNNNASESINIDGITVPAISTSKFLATSGTGAAGATAYSPGSATATPLLKVSGVFETGSTFALHGTIYAVKAAVDLSQTGVAMTVVDRGIVARDVYLGMTRLSTYTGAMISIPGSSYQPRVVLFTISVAGVAKLRVQATFSNGAGADGVTTVALSQWAHL